MYNNLLKLYNHDIITCPATNPSPSHNSESILRKGQKTAKKFEIVETAKAVIAKSKEFRVCSSQRHKATLPELLKASDQKS